MRETNIMRTVHCSAGFISIDCGYTGETYVDSENEAKLQFSPDAGFTDDGSNHIISIEYMSNTALSKRLYNVRSFPNGVRNCYMIQPLMPGLSTSSAPYSCTATTTASTDHPCLTSTSASTSGRR